MLEKPFDRALRRLRHDRAAGRIADADYLHRRAADELLERLDSVQRSFSDALILGPGTSDLAEAIGRRGLAVTVAGSARPSGHRRFVQCDEDLLPFRDGAFDLVLSVGALDTVNDLPGALTLIRRSLRPDGLFLAALAGAGGLPRLRSAMLAADEAQSGSAAPRLHPQIDIQAAGDLLTRAGFALPVVDGEAVSVRFPNLISLIADLRAMGATNLLAGQSAAPFTRLALGAALADFAAHADSDGKTAERFEILYLTGWAPAPSQPQPARRGSGRTSLADALKPAP